MKSLFIPIAVLTIAFSTQSCSKEPETIIETVTVTETDTVAISHSAAVYLEPFSQSDWGSLGFSSVAQNFTVENISDVKLNTVVVTFEATTSDNSKYTGKGYIYDINPGDQISDQAYISTADKECSSVKVKEIEITVY